MFDQNIFLCLLSIILTGLCLSLTLFSALPKNAGKFLINFCIRVFIIPEATEAAFLSLL